MAVAAAGLVAGAAAAALGGTASAAASVAGAPAVATARTAPSAALTADMMMARPGTAGLAGSGHSGQVNLISAPAPARAVTGSGGSSRQGATRTLSSSARRATQVHRAAAAPAGPTQRQLIPHGTSGPQAWMQLGSSQLRNARTIVHQAMGKGMGPRAAVIAVATAMQESQLVNVNYGTAASLGLFQQQPNYGWGTAAQIMNPAHAADAFLNALRQHQASDPGWASQPLWANAQAVQRSAFPFAYAKWEAQAAHLVKTILS